jgi:ATP-dependent Clp protease ATP-binding subunit ClpA
MSPEDHKPSENRTPLPDSIDKFTESAQRALAFSQEEARRLGHTYIGTEHLLLGLLRDDQTVAGRILNDMGVTIASGRKALTLITPAQPERRRVGEIGLTPRAKKAIELSIQEAHESGDQFIGTEHLLLGILREDEGASAGILTDLGIGINRVRKQILYVREAKRATTETSTTRNNVVSFRLGDRTLAALDALVEAGVCNTRSEAAAWLVEAGITAKQDLFQQVYTTVAQIRALRAQVQMLTNQQSQSSPGQSTPDASADTPTSPEDDATNE